MIAGGKYGMINRSSDFTNLILSIQKGEKDKKICKPFFENALAKKQIKVGSVTV